MIRYNSYHRDGSFAITFGQIDRTLCKQRGSWSSPGSPARSLWRKNRSFSADPSEPQVTDNCSMASSSDSASSYLCRNQTKLRKGQKDTTRRCTFYISQNLGPNWDLQEMTSHICRQEIAWKMKESNLFMSFKKPLIWLVCGLLGNIIIWTWEARGGSPAV